MTAHVLGHISPTGDDRFEAWCSCGKHIQSTARQGVENKHDVHKRIMGLREAAKPKGERR